jgi:hypothetical protein
MEDDNMKTIVLATMFALGLGLAGMGGAFAAPLGNGLNTAAANNSSLVQVQWHRHCRTVCRRGPYGRRHCERVCYR